MNMKPAYWFSLAVFLLAAVFLVHTLANRNAYGLWSQKPAGTAGASAAVPTTTAQNAAAQQRVRTLFGRMPLYFVENRGQVDRRVAYYAQGRDTAVYFTSEGVAFTLRGPSAARPHGAETAKPELRPAAFRGEPEPREETPRWVLKLDFVGANHSVKPKGGERSDAVMSYFKGQQREWKTGLPMYTSIVYPNLWPGIDLVYSGDQSRMKYTFVVQPGADPKQIRLAYRGADALRVNAAGQLEVSTPAGDLREEKPYAYQEHSSQRVEVEATYSLDALTTKGTRGFSFRVGAYDRNKPLVLDPVTLVYAGYIGGSGNDTGYGIAVDSAGNAYVTGYTGSSEATFPVTVGPDLTWNGNYDAFVVKVKADGTGLDYAGYIGGSGNDLGYGIAVDGGGNAYVTGKTDSTEATFPVTVGPDLTFNGGWDAFVAKVKADGTGLAYAGYIGGSGTYPDEGRGIAVDSAGNAYVAGYTNSDQTTFPVSVGPDLTYNGGYADGFVAKVKADGTGLVYSGFIGGSGDDYCLGIAVDSTDSAYIAGRTNSTEATFPVAVGPDLTYNGLYDAFVAKVKADGTGLVYAGYVGGSGADVGLGIAADSVGNAYITGNTNSSEATFPVTVGPDLTHNGGTYDAFVAKVKADGTGLDFAGYIGGSAWDLGYGIAVDSGGSVYIAGYTDSNETTFPVAVGPDLTFNGIGDAFVAKVKADGTGLDFAGYIGGSGQEYGNGIAVDTAGNAYVTGLTQSTEATFPVSVGPDLTYNGIVDAFVAKVAMMAMIPDSDLSLSKADSPDPVIVGGSLTYTLTVTNSGPDTASSVSLTDTLPGSVVFGSATASQGSCSHSAGIVTCDLGTLANGASATVTIVVATTAASFGTITNTASVSSAENDPNPANNTATEPTTVIDTIPPAVVATRPNGGEKLFIGSPFQITWTASDNIGLSFFDVFYSTNGGSTYTAVPNCSGVPGTQSSCTWAAPWPTTTAGRIKVIAYDTSGNSASDASNANYSVVAGTGSITVTAPNTAVDWGIGSTQQIKWNHNLGLNAYVKIEASLDAGATWSDVVASFKNTGATVSTYNWLVNSASSYRALVRVSWTANPATADVSNVEFTLSKPYLVAAAPATTATNYGYGSRRTLNWTSNLGPGDRLRVLLSADGGATWPTILGDNLAGTVKTLSFDTPTLALATDAARLRVETKVPSAITINGFNPVDFHIEPAYVRVTSPNGPANAWTVGSTRTITWANNLGAPENVLIELSLNDGASYTIVLYASTPSDGTQTVTVLAGWVTQTARVRITWLKNGAVMDFSDQAFPIQ
ncbi:MAG: SBBP repeat-containing protein [Candidatus Koribacter versatilis]|nr:SBBP repeat-containing protein [Candidatus Koribacter versatilis]